MKKTLEIGDVVALKPAVLFGLETYIKARLDANIDADFHVGTIEWGRESFGDDEARRTIISFIEPPKPVEIATAPQNSAVRTYQWTIFIQGMLVDNLKIPTYPAYELVAEIKMILNDLVETNSGSAVNNILNLGPTAQRERGNRNNLHNIHIGAETVRGPGDHSRYAYFWLPVHLSIAEDIKNPRTTIQNPL